MDSLPGYPFASPVGMLPVAEPPPDVVLLAQKWQPRALLRAQLIEEGFRVVAADTWPMARDYLRGASKPRLAIIDLDGLTEVEGILHDVRELMPPARVVVVTALGTMPPEQVERLGFRVVRRPLLIKDVLAAAAHAAHQA